jgi:glycosyltransferase involved in cell wall biosynthesis
VKPTNDLHIALIGPLPPPSGGMANQTLQLERLLRASDIHIRVIQVNPPYQPAWIRHAWGVRALFRLLPYIFALWRTTRQVELIHVMANSGWSWHLFAAPAIWIAYLRGTRVIVNYHGGNAEAFFAHSFPLIKPTLKLVDLIIVPSDFLKEIFARRGLATCVVPNAIDLDFFRRTRHTPDFSAPHLLIARNLEPIYDIPTALKAFAIVRKKLPHARLTIAGTGSQREALQHLAQQLDIMDAVTFTGRLDSDRIYNLYIQADLMLNSSTVDNMPISILEALACGVPVVSSNVGGIPYMVQDNQTALLVPPGNEQAMAEAALKVLNDAKLAARLSDAGIAMVKKFAWPQVREQLLAAYHDALSGKRKNQCNDIRGVKRS